MNQPEEYGFCEHCGCGGRYDTEWRTNLWSHKVGCPTRLEILQANRARVAASKK
jgi:hypothetical protein